MTPSPAINVTQILQEMDRGHSEAADQLLPLVYEELRRLASFQMAKEVSNHTLQPTALVHEAYLRLVGGGDQGWANRKHFFAAAAESMRRILVERARKKQRLRHGGHLQQVTSGVWMSPWMLTTTSCCWFMKPSPVWKRKMTRVQN